MISSAPPQVLSKKRAERQTSSRWHAARHSAGLSPERRPFLRIPPFPGARIREFQQSSSKPNTPAAASVVAAELCRLRVGGSYWGAQPRLTSGCVVVRTPDALDEARRMAASRELVLWTEDSALIEHGTKVRVIRGICDPWHVMESASVLFAEAADEVCAIAALCGVPVRVRDAATGAFDECELDAPELIGRLIPSEGVLNPFTGEPMTGLATVQLCGFWRKLIDSNRNLGGALGFSFWKQQHVAPLLWGGGDFRFLKSADIAARAPSIAIWRSKTPQRVLAELEAASVKLVEVEDGFLRSRGLGADCIPPLSLTVDRLGAHFDPAKPSELESVLQNGAFDEALLARARSLRRLIVETGLGKYGQGRQPLGRRGGERRLILVPGQVEGDRSVEAGGCGISTNIELLKRVRAHAPDAYILYKPHPDVLAGHRGGSIPERLCLAHADEVIGDLPIASLIEMADEVHVNTSLAGFEALLRQKHVTTYGVPFYAGWGVTEDLGPVPARRKARRSVDELVAATLLLYPRYLDPQTGLPCPAEVVAARLVSRQQDDPGLLVHLRRVQGRLMRRLGIFAQ